MSNVTEYVRFDEPVTGSAGTGADKQFLPRIEAQLHLFVCLAVSALSSISAFFSGIFSSHQSILC